MPITRVLMLLALTVPLVGLMYGMSAGGGANPAKAMTVELSCLAGGALLFFLAYAAEKKRGSS
jgi:hypothetical protein